MKYQYELVRSLGKCVSPPKPVARGVRPPSLLSTPGVTASVLWRKGLLPMPLVAAALRDCDWLWLPAGLLKNRGLLVGGAWLCELLCWLPPGVFRCEAARLAPDRD